MSELKQYDGLSVLLFLETMVCINSKSEPFIITFVPPQKREAFGIESVVFIYEFIIAFI